MSISIGTMTSASVGFLVLGIGVTCFGVYSMITSDV